MGDDWGIEEALRNVVVLWGLIGLAGAIVLSVVFGMVSELEDCHVGPDR